MDEAEFEGVTADFNEIVEESTEASQGVGGAEECDVSKLYEHLEVVVKRPLVLRGGALHLHLADGPAAPGLCAGLWRTLAGGRTEGSEQIKAHFGQLELLLDVRNERLLGTHRPRYVMGDRRQN